jgi:adenosylmethionine-8-amino-7-oxononanoate aminotransferase
MKEAIPWGLKDRRYLWHPFTQMKDWQEEEPLIIVAGDGVWLEDIQGRRYLDGVSSLWVNLHGHRKAEIDQAIREQINRISHTTLLGLANLPSVELAEQLIKITAPLGLAKVFYSDSGSEAVEVSLKLAFQYWQHKGVKTKTKFIYLENAYHGDTLGAVSVGGVELFHKVFQPLLFPTYKTASPYCYRCSLGYSPSSCKLACLGDLEEILRQHEEEIAAVIIEPLLQAAGGIIVHPRGYLKGVRELTTRYNTLLITDEIATGFGRTGKMFACEHEGVSPDLMTVAKGLTAGYLPLAATLTSEEVFLAFLGDYAECKTFFHGHTYTGNPLACAAAIANLRIFAEEKTLEQLPPKIDLFSKRLQEFWELPGVGDIRQIGLVAGVELVRDKQTKEPYAWEEKMGIRVCSACRSRGLILRPLGNVIVLMPPLAITEAELNLMLDIVAEAIREVVDR